MRAPRRVLLLTLVAILAALASASDDEAPSTVTPKSERVTPLGRLLEAQQVGPLYPDPAVLQLVAPHT